MIREVKGNILATTAEVLVNPVNTVGVMGAGLAAQVKHAHPVVFREYVNACRAGAISTGTVMAHRTGSNPRYVISFPTKRHWRQPSELEWIDQGLAHLRIKLSELDISSIAIPPLGCGLGGLNWTDVRALIYSHLDELPGVDILLYSSK